MDAIRNEAEVLKKIFDLVITMKWTWRYGEEPLLEGPTQEDMHVFCDELLEILMQPHSIFIKKLEVNNRVIELLERCVNILLETGQYENNAYLQEAKVLIREWRSGKEVVIGESFQWQDSDWSVYQAQVR